jgi:AhpD family alkylhydroperoxidase
MMTQRLAMPKVAPEAYEAVLGLERYVVANVEPQLYELIKVRASLMNRCAYCIDMHSFEALKAGENQQRLLLLSVWHEVPHLYTDRERAALALTEEVTRLGEHGVTDETWDAAAELFSETELANLIVAIATINVWNRFGVSTQVKTGARTA